MNIENQRNFAVKGMLFFLSLCMLIPAIHAAEKKTDILLKFSEHGKAVRVVLEGEESFLNRVKVVSSPSQIKAEFPGPFHLATDKQLPFTFVQTGSSLSLNLKEEREVKFFRLSSPARIVFDITGKGAQTEKKTVSGQAEPQTGKKPEQVERQPRPAQLTIGIDAGHGGYDFGIVEGTEREKDLNLTFAKELGAALTKSGKKVFLVRKADQHISLAERIDIAEQRRPDIFLSLHTSLSGDFVLYTAKYEDQTAGEAETAYVLSSRQRRFLPKSTALSEHIETALKEAFQGKVTRKEMGLPILQSISAVCLLLEFPSPQTIKYDQQTRSKIIKTVMAGLTAYDLRMRGITVPEPVPQKP